MVRTAPQRTIRMKELPMIASASVSLPRPLSMEQRGAPPMPNRLAKAITMEMIGRQSPKPVRAMVASSGIRPIKIRSTILYNTLISWAKVMGRASRRMFPTTLPLEKSFLADVPVLVWDGWSVMIATPLFYLYAVCALCPSQVSLLQAFEGRRAALRFIPL